MLGRGAVQVQVADLLRLQPGLVQSLAHRLLGTPAGRLRRGNVVRIGAGAAAQQGDRLAVSGLFAHQEQHRRFADIDAVAVQRKRVAAFAGHRLQRGKTVEGQLAQRVDATAQHHIAHPQIEQAPGAHQRAGAGGARGGNHIGGAAQLQPLGEEICRCAELLLLIVIRVWKALIADVVGQPLTGFVDARRAGAQHHADAMAAVSLDRVIDVLANLQGGFKQQLIVAAALPAQLGRDRRQLAAHRAHRQRSLRHPAGLAAHAGAIAGKQVAGDFLLAAPQRADHPEGVQVGRHGVSPLRGVIL
ncbi:hypothetical protein D3C84_580230 [compost metagenome]